MKRYMYIFKLSNWYRYPLHPSVRKTTLALNPSSLPFKRLITSETSVLHYSHDIRRSATIHHVPLPTKGTSYHEAIGVLNHSGMTWCLTLMFSLTNMRLNDVDRHFAEHLWFVRELIWILPCVKWCHCECSAFSDGLIENSLSTKTGHGTMVPQSQPRSAPKILLSD